MSQLSGLFRRISQANPVWQLVAVLGLFLVCRLLSLVVFFDGFLTLFARLDHVVSATPTYLSWQPYQQASIVLGALLHPVFLITLALFYLPLWRKRTALREASFRFSVNERLIVFVAAALLAWELSTYDYNYYLDRALYADRALLVILALLIPRFPLLVPLFVAFAYVYRSQFNYPADGFPLYDKRLLFDLLILFTAHVYARLYLRSYRVSFLFLALCLLAAGYVAGAFMKLVISPHGIEWLLSNNPADLFYNSHLRGWLAGAPDALLDKLGNFFERYGKILQAMAFFIEVSALFILRSRKTGIAVLCALLAMHTGIFLLAGILFWKWMAIDLVLLFCYLYRKGLWMKGLFEAHHYRASLVVICLSFAWLQPIPFAWHDTPANQFFTYELEDDEGTIYTLDKNAMNPYHQWFQIDRFLFLVDTPCLPLTGFGYTYKYKIAKDIAQSGPEHFAELSRAKGKIYFQPELRRHYEAFIQTYFRNRNKRLGLNFFPACFMAPLHLYTAETGRVWDGRKPVRRFRVKFNQTYTSHGTTRWLRREVIDDILIAP